MISQSPYTHLYWDLAGPVSLCYKDEKQQAVAGPAGLALLTFSKLLTILLQPQKHELQGTPAVFQLCCQRRG